MRHLWISRSALAIVSASLLGPSAGCGGGAADAYRPSESTARMALEAALSAWQGGQSPGPIAGTTPAILAVDSAWKAGEKLAAYEISGEEPEEGARRFAVRLTMKPAGPTKEARYVIQGQGPIWVYREEDFSRSANMDNNPAPKPNRRGRRPR